jgi:DNA segregation ATPase FtsK/SpoIIIE-like protein
MVGLDGRIRGATRKTPPPIELPTPESVEEAAAEPAVESAPGEALALIPSSGASPSIIETQALAPTKRKPKRGAFRLLQTGKGFKLPSLDLLESTPEIRSDIDRNALTDTAQRLTAKLADFGIKGRVETIRPGPVDVQTTPTDATLSWADGETRGSAAMPIADFQSYVAKGLIALRA